MIRAQFCCLVSGVLATGTLLPLPSPVAQRFPTFFCATDRFHVRQFSWTDLQGVADKFDEKMI